MAGTGVDAPHRARTLTIEEWVRLAEGLGCAEYCAGSVLRRQNVVTT